MPTARRIAPWAIDALLGVGLTLTMVGVISVNHGGEQDPDALAYLWAIGLGALMLARRRYPVLVLTVTVLGLFAYYAAGYPAVGVAVPIAAALYSAAEFGRMAWAIGAGAVALITSVTFRLLEGQQISLVAGYELAGHAFLIVGAIGLGDSVRSRRSLAAHARQLVILTSQRTRRESEVRAQAQRIAVARDLHDSIGHSTAVLSLHADVAREAVERGDDAAATGALRVIKDAAGSTMSDLRRTVTLLRTPEQPGVAAKGLADVQDLSTGAPDVRVSTDIDVPAEIPGAVDAAAYRIIQESVTNITRHSSATHAHIEVRCPGTELTISVSDNAEPAKVSDNAEPGEPAGSGKAGSGQSSSGQPGSARSSTPTGPGYGIDGMRERAEALGGTLQAGPGPDGFTVRARIPVGRNR